MNYTIPKNINKYEIYLDFETTGVSQFDGIKVHKAQIVQIGCIGYKSGKKTLHFDVLCKPPCIDIAYNTYDELINNVEATNNNTLHVHGIDSNQLLNKTTESEALEQLMMTLNLFADGCKDKKGNFVKPTIIGHNIFQYDIPLLWFRLTYHGWTKRDILNTLERFTFVDSCYEHKRNASIAQNKNLLYAHPDYNRLAAAASLFNYTSHNNHNALGDCLASKFILYKEQFTLTDMAVDISKQHLETTKWKHWFKYRISYMTIQDIKPIENLNELLNRKIYYGKYIGTLISTIKNNNSFYYEEYILKSNQLDYFFELLNKITQPV